MGVFDDQWTRLKLALGLSEDQDVATALGMTKAAFSARKTRGSFPVEKVKALAVDRPELRLDVQYVLTGMSDELQRRLQAVSSATRVASQVKDKGERSAVQQDVFQALVDSLSDEEQQLVHGYRRADAKGKALLLATVTVVGGAAAVSNEKPVRKAGARAVTRTSKR